VAATRAETVTKVVKVNMAVCGGLGKVGGCEGGGVGGRWERIDC
jgi:hypothetical protein